MNCDFTPKQAELSLSKFAHLFTSQAGTNHPVFEPKSTLTSDMANPLMKNYYMQNNLAKNAVYNDILSRMTSGSNISLDSHTCVLAPLHDQLQGTIASLKREESALSEELLSVVTQLTQARHGGDVVRVDYERMPIQRVGNFNIECGGKEVEQTQTPPDLSEPYIVIDTEDASEIMPDFESKMNYASHGDRYYQEYIRKEYAFRQKLDRIYKQGSYSELLACVSEAEANGFIKPAELKALKARLGI